MALDIPATRPDPRSGTTERDRAQLAAAAIGRMQIISRRVRRHARLELEPLGLTVAQVRALRELGRLSGHDRAPDAGCIVDDAAGALPGVRMGALAMALDVVPRSATDVVEALERLSLVARRPDPDDGRAVVVSLTATGHDLLHVLAERRRDASLEALDALSTHDLQALDDLLARALGAC